MNIKPGDIIRADDELRWAINNNVIVAIIMLNQCVDVDVIENFNPYLIQLPGNRFYFRDEIQIEVPPEATL